MKTLIILLLILLVSGAEAKLLHAGALKPVYFDTDDDRFRAEGALRGHVAWLKQNRHRVVVIEGHCDERGSEAYNLALGDRRARSVMAALIASGISEKQLMIMSYGEDQPRAQGSSELQWANNRRVEFTMR